MYKFADFIRLLSDFCYVLAGFQKEEPIDFLGVWV